MRFLMTPNCRNHFIIAATFPQRINEVNRIVIRWAIQGYRRQTLPIARQFAVFVTDIFVLLTELLYQSTICLYYSPICGIGLLYALNCSLICDNGHRYASNRSQICSICHQYPCIAHWIAVSTTDMLVSLTNSLYRSLICLHRLPNCCIVHR